MRLLLPLLLTLLPLAGGMAHPWALPLLTGGASELGNTATSSPPAMATALQDVGGWRYETALVSEDIARITSRDESTRASGDGMTVSLAWDRVLQDRGTYRYDQRALDYAYHATGEQSHLALKQTDHQASITFPPFRQWRVGVEVTDQKLRAQGATTLVAGTLGDQPMPEVVIDADYSEVSVALSHAWARGGLGISVGQLSSRMDLAIDDTHDLALPLNYRGPYNGGFAWINLPRGCVKMQYAAGRQTGTGDVFYDDILSGNSTGEQQVRRGAITLQPQQGPTITLGYAALTQQRSAYATRPESSWTALGNGRWELTSAFGEVAHRWERRRQQRLDLTYQLHRLHLVADGVYRAGLLGGLLETERLTGDADQQGWLHFLQLDLSTPLRGGRVGYRGAVTVPLLDDGDESSTPPSPDAEQSKTRGGLTHTLYWQQAF